MQKVKVNRYVSGKRPEYAPIESSDEEEGEFNFGKNKKAVGLPQVRTEAEKEDRRLKRLQDRHREEDDEDEEDRYGINQCVITSLLWNTQGRDLARTPPACLLDRQFHENLLFRHG